jgi:hypothetical protein
MKNKKKKAKGDELVFPLIALAFTIYYLSTIWNLAWEAQINGVLIGGILIVLILIFLVKIAVEYFKGDASLRLEKLVSLDKLQVKRIGLLLLAVAYVFFIQWTGLTLTTFLLLIAIMVLLGVRSPLLILGISIVLSALGYLFFIVLLDTRFPPGPIERLIERLF